MAYNLLYYFDTIRNNQEIRLNILKRDDSDGGISMVSLPKRIGSLQALNLEIQGGDNALETAIVKTALHFSLEDCFDKPNETITRINAEGNTETEIIKYGNWEELYTPDSTLFKVVLLEGGVTRWSGYLTPDSWEESLTYHSVLSLTARDNLGHLSDIDFDLEDESGLNAFTLGEIILGAKERVSLAMSLDMGLSDLRFVGPEGNLVPCTGVYFNAEGFEGLTWYDALEGVLDSLGLCLRYVDNNTIAVRTLRSYSIDDAMGRTEKQIRLTNNSGHLSKSPAYRQISETWTPNSDNAIASIKRESSDYARPSTGSTTKWVCSSSSEWVNKNDLMLINPFALTDPKHLRSYDPNPESVLLLQVSSTSGAPGVNSSRIERTIKVSGASLDMGLEFTFGIVPCKVVNETTYDYLAKSLVSSALSTTLYFSLKAKKNSSVLYFNDSTGDWDSVARIISVSGTYGQSGTQRKAGATDVTYNVDFPASGLSEITIVFYGFNLTTTDSLINSDKSAFKLYCPLTSCVVSQKDVDFPDRVVTTIYNEHYNTQLKREPRFGELNFSVVNAAVVKNGLYCLASDGSLATMNKWNFQGQDQETHLPVLIHQEILTYHAKANNTLSGSVLDVTANSPHIGDAFVYQEIKYLLAGGSLDLFTGMLDNAVLRQYNDYSELWDTLYAVTLEAVGNQKLQVVKALKAATGMGLKEATTLVNSAPCVVYETYNYDVAVMLRNNLEAVGATASISAV